LYPKFTAFANFFIIRILLMPRTFPFLLLMLLVATSCGFLRNGPPPPPRDNAQADPQQTVDTPKPTPTSTEFVLTSPDVVEAGNLPAEYTCDGASATLPLAWKNVPAGTTSFAVVMHHIPGPGDSHWYWVLYNIPATVTSLAKNSQGVGTLGTNSVNNRTEYSPPCSKGPGAKDYTYTIYALASTPEFTVAPDAVDRDTLLAAIADRTLGNATLNIVYSR
jgi:phosphatidylethanolamine-binding protein (PEBP) family uncharacterized protein